MKIYDFDVEDEIQKNEIALQNVELIKNSFADHTAEYRKFSREVNVEFSALSDCIDAYERALLIGVYTYAEQLVKNFYYELLEKDRSENLYARNFINKKLDIDELCDSFKFIINKNRDEIAKYDDLIRNRHRYAHRGVFQSSVEQYRDVINAEKYISTELSMIIANGKEYRIEYQNGWTEICSLIKECYGLIICSRHKSRGLRFL